MGVSFLVKLETEAVQSSKKRKSGNLVISVNFARFVRTPFIQKIAGTWGIHKNL